MAFAKLVRSARIRWVAAAAVTATALGLLVASVLANRAVYVLEVDGQALGVVHGKAAVKQALDTLKAEATTELGRPVKVGRQVATVRYVGSQGTSIDAIATQAGGQAQAQGEQAQGAAGRGTPTQGSLPDLATPAAIEDVLRSFSPLVVDGFMIRVDGRDVVGLLEQTEAQAVVDELKGEEAKRIEKRGGSVTSLEFEQKTTIEAALIPLDQLRTKAEAKAILARGTDKIETYVVSRGDSLWKIASEHGTTVDSLLKANPEVDPKTAVISVGQKLNLIAATPYVSIVSVEVRTVKERIPFPVQVIEDPSLWPWQTVVKQPGTSGVKEVTYRTERHTADRKEKTSVVGEKVLSEPTIQVEVHGTKRAPALGTGTFYWPVPTGSITSGFGWRRFKYHTGIDIAAPRGTEVSAADAGTIVFLGSKGSYGRTIMIDHGNGHLVTLYGHLNGYASGLKEGSTVTKGQLIGYVGSSGNSTGPHLHFEVRVDGKAVNPLTYYSK